MIIIIVLKLMGGLGNQMFQYAYARQLQIVYDEPLFLDISSYDSYKIREFSLSNLFLNNDIKYVEQSGISKLKIKYLKIKQKKYRYFQRLYKIILKTDELGEKSFKTMSSKGLYYTFDRQFYEFRKTNKKIKSVYGYFPSEKYFKDIKEDIKQELKVKSKLSKEANIIFNEILEINNAVGVSIRWGKDYKKSNLYYCEKEYYYKGMNYIASKIDNPTFYIFSDRIEEVKNDFEFDFPVKYIAEFDDFESLKLLYTCDHFVIANSTFSWFGAYLSENPNKITVAPNKWFKDSIKNPDIYLNEMELIKV